MSSPQPLGGHTPPPLKRGGHKDGLSRGGNPHSFIFATELESCQGVASPRSSVVVVARMSEWLFSVLATAAPKGHLFSDSRLGFPLLLWPARCAALIYTMPPSCREASCAHKACVNLCFTRQAVR